MTVSVALLQEFVMKEPEKRAMTSPLKGGKSWHLKKSNDTTIILSGGKRERATRLGGRAADPGFSTNKIAQARFYVWSTYFFANLHTPISSSCFLPTRLRRFVFTFGVLFFAILHTPISSSCFDNSWRVILQRCCHNTNEHWSMVTGSHSKWTIHWSSLELLPFQPLLVNISCSIQNSKFPATSKT